MKHIVLLLVLVSALSQSPLQSIVNYTLLSRDNNPTLLLLSTAKNEDPHYAQTYHELLSIHLKNSPYDPITIIYELDEYQLACYQQNSTFLWPHYIHIPIMLLTQYIFENREYQKFSWHPCEQRAPFITQFMNYLCDILETDSSSQLRYNYTLHTLSHYLAGSLNRMDSFIAKTESNSIRNQYLLSIKKEMLEIAFAIRDIIGFGNMLQKLSLAIKHLNQKNLQKLLELISYFDNYIVSTAYADFLLDTLAPITNKKIVVMLREEYINLLVPILLLSNFEKKDLEEKDNFLCSFNQALDCFFS